MSFIYVLIMNQKYSTFSTNIETHDRDKRKKCLFRFFVCSA